MVKWDKIFVTTFKMVKLHVFKENQRNILVSWGEITIKTVINGKIQSTEKQYDKTRFNIEKFI